MASPDPYEQVLASVYATGGIIKPSGAHLCKYPFAPRLQVCFFHVRVDAHRTAKQKKTKPNQPNKKTLDLFLSCLINSEVRGSLDLIPSL